MLHKYEEFSPAQELLLEQYVTNTKSSIFVLRNLPEVIKGALFSRYSRSTLGLRSLLLREFIQNSEETGFAAIAGNTFTGPSPTSIPSVNSQDQLLAIKKAQNFYDRILDGYGDDSIGELGGAHLAIENISMLAAKAIEDCRIGGSPLEKSTRYIYFDQKIQGEYLFYKEPVLMTSAWKSLYLSTCNMLFETYSKLIPPLTVFMEERFPKDAEVSKSAYTAAIRAKVLDCIRGLLPASTLTNMGVFGNGRFFENIIHKLQIETLAELQEIGHQSYKELSKVIPSFVRRSDLYHKHHQSQAIYHESVCQEVKEFLKDIIASKRVEKPHLSTQSGPTPATVTIMSFDENALQEIVTALFYEESHYSWNEINKMAQQLSKEDIAKLFDAVTLPREHRRHKSPRALEHGFTTFEIMADFGAFRDLQRHRMLSQERQLLTCRYGYYMPQELIESGLDTEYKKAMDIAKEAYDTIASELPEEAQYVVPMAYNIRWHAKLNIRALQWIAELRSQAAGHPTYRYIAQEMAQAVIEKEPLFEKFLRFVDYQGYDIGRLSQEIRTEKKRQIFQESIS